MKKLILILAFFPLLSWGQATGINGAWNINGDLTYAFPHCVASVVGGAYTPTLTQNVPFKLLPSMISVEIDGITFAGDTVTLPATPATADWLVEIWCDISSGNNNDFRFDCRINTVPITTSYWQGTTTNTTNYTPVYYKWYLHAAVANSKISFYITNITNNDDPIIRRFKIYVSKVPEL